MIRSRRKSTTAKNVVVESNEESTSESELDDDQSNSVKKKIQIQSKRFRMKQEDDEIFVQLCVEKFDQINDTSTNRGTPTSSQVKSRQKNVQNAWNSITTAMNKAMKVNNSADYYKKKFENIKGKARKRQSLVEKQKQTGGGSLTKMEQSIVLSPGYTDLALKLGKSAFGSEARNDSDAQGTSSQTLQPPTERLRNILKITRDSANKSSGNPEIDDSQASTSNTSKSRQSFQGAFGKNTDESQTIPNTSEELDLTTQPSTDIHSPRNKRAQSRRSTIDFDSETSSSKRLRKEDSMSSGGDYRDILTENLLRQNENHQLQHELLTLHKEKMEISIEMSRIELEKAKIDLDTARALAEIEINKQKRLAELEIEIKTKNLQN